MSAFDFGVQFLDVDKMTYWGKCRDASFWIETRASRCRVADIEICASSIRRRCEFASRRVSCTIRNGAVCFIPSTARVFNPEAHPDTCPNRSSCRV